MYILESLAIISLAALIHATFQLSVSVLTLMSGHAIGSRAKHSRLLKLSWNFIFGVAVSTVLLLATAVFITTNTLKGIPESLLWAGLSGLVIGLGIAVGLFYYRWSSPGTTLWLPRSLARYLSSRARKTKQSAESFALGIVTIFLEIIFVLPPIFIAGLTISHLENMWQLFAVLLYLVISLMPLLILGILIGGGKSPSRIQAWREKNKLFLQFTACAGLMILGIYLYISHVTATEVVPIVQDLGGFNG